MHGRQRCAQRGGSRDDKGGRAEPQARQDVGRAGPSGGQGANLADLGSSEYRQKKWRRGSGKQAITLLDNEGLHEQNVLENDCE